MEIDTDNLHHAYLIVGEKGEGRDYLTSLFSRLKVEEVGNPDFFLFEEEVFGVDNARALGTRAGQKAFGERKVFVILADRMTVEAQNALLKTFEDPYPNTHFFVLMRSEGALLPTLLSRMCILKVDSQGISEELPKKFLKLSMKERLLFAKDFEGNLAEFLDGLLLELRGKEGVQEVFSSRRFADDRSASARLVLEHIALVV